MIPPLRHVDIDSHPHEFIAIEIISSITNRDESHHLGYAYDRWSHCVDRRWSCALTAHSNHSAGLHVERNRPTS
ncbi:protein of unknown function [Citrobacter amalonaticus]|uniref:Uncharacterized protein n=1 Tax=Citrobacter amalonaticus TaxID=35703 RepID=A0AAX2BKL4_CITAM|nr:protein of unknown function [Citrobacter amalonaticus]